MNTKTPKKLPQTVAKQLSVLFNSCSVYSNMTNHAVAEKDFQTVENAMKWHNEAAQELLKYGVVVGQYKI